MGDALAAGNLIIYVLFGVFGVIGSLFMLYINSQFKQRDESTKTNASELKEFKETSKNDDDEVKADLTKEMDRRIKNIEQLHAKVEDQGEKLSQARERVARIEGLHEQHKS